MASLGNNLSAAIAFNRFGLGGRPDDAVPPSATAWLTAQLGGPDGFNASGLPNTASALSVYAAWRAGTPAQQAVLGQQIYTQFGNDISAHMAYAVTTKAPFRERLVWFWTNHFALMANHMSVMACAGPFVREAIRPYVNGSFKDMVLAVMQHPAMLYNLNNVSSTGPNSAAGQRCASTGCLDRGINENLARECLELHTVGIDAGYTQADVDALAMLISGWTVNLSTAPRGFSFNPNAHQPGSQVVMGQTFDGTQNGGLAALAFLATHPATYQHLATQLVTHFVSDTPSASDIATVAAALSSSGGNLAAASTALVNLSSAWTPYSKLRTPQEYAVAVMRATGATGPGTTTVTNVASSAMALGEPVWQPAFPNGYSDLAADWGGPAQMLLRADWISALTTALPALDPATVSGCALGPLLRSPTTAAMNAATTTHDKMSLLFLSPDFQRR